MGSAVMSISKETEYRMANILFMLLCFILAFPARCEGSFHRQLRNDLMSKYGDVFVVPVKDTSTPTVITVRPLFNRLVKMDMKEQYFIMDTWLKMAWVDEFLTWDPANYNGTTEIYLPADKVWTPDITFYENVDLSFQRFKPDTVIIVTSEGQLTWFVPSMFVSGCSIRVKWFPYDIQVCDMTFGSFAYSGKEIVLMPEISKDADQNRYLDNGVWDLVTSSKKRVATHYSCCPFPYYEVQYRLIFKRHPEFYIKYLIIPVFLLSILSLMVFYLPADSGEKITLCITNLLALVVFQQIITDNMPPSGSESPVIGNFFLSMIIIVGSSVISTIAVIRMNSISHRPAPRWIYFVARLVRLDAMKTSRLLLETGSDTKIEVKTAQCFDEQLKEEEQNQHDWKLVSLVVDRLLMSIFCTTTVVVTAILLVIIVNGSEREFEEEIEILNNSWRRDTQRFL